MGVARPSYGRTQGIIYVLLSREKAGGEGGRDNGDTLLPPLHLTASAHVFFTS